MDQHKKGKIFLILFSLTLYIIMVMFNIGAGSGAFRGVFLQTVGNISNKYDTELTPEGWTFFIWDVIFAWHFLWLGYAVSGICRRNELGWMYTNPNVLPAPFYLLWMLNNIFNIGWLFLWDRQYLVPALVFLSAITLTTYGTLFLSYRALYLHGHWLQTFRRADLWLIRILVQNGIAVYATWTTVATLLNFAVVLTYKGDVSNQTSTTVSLSILAFELAVWFCLENFYLDQYVRYTVTIYPVVIVALSGNVYKNYKPSAPGLNYIFAAVLLGTVCITFLLRLGIVIWKHFKRPLYQPAMLPKSSVSLLKVKA